MTLRCEVPGNWTGYNPAWVDTTASADHLLAGWHAPADQVLILGIGADAYLVAGATVLTMSWKLGPGETRAGWLIRPHKNYEDDVALLRKKDWPAEWQSAEQAWIELLRCASRVVIPDAGVRNAFYACRVDLDIQEPNGDWTERKYWSHLMWGTAGFKAWVVMEHFWLSGDRVFLAKRFPQMPATSRWQEKQRARTRPLDSAGSRPLTHGLMISPPAPYPITQRCTAACPGGTTRELLSFLYITRGSAGEVRSMLCLLETLDGFTDFKSEISNLKSPVEGVSRQLRAWADSLQNSNITGQRYLTEKQRGATKIRADRLEFLQKLQRIREGNEQA